MHLWQRRAFNLLRLPFCDCSLFCIPSVLWNGVSERWENDKTRILTGDNEFAEQRSAQLMYKMIFSFVCHMSKHIRVYTAAWNWTIFLFCFSNAIQLGMRLVRNTRGDISRQVMSTFNEMPLPPLESCYFTQLCESSWHRKSPIRWFVIMYSWF